MSTEREKFEAWLLAEQGLTATWNESRNCFDEFPAHLAHKAWQAKAADSAERDNTTEDLGDWLTDLQMIQNTAEAPGDWREEFTAWYVPERWMGVHRAACVFIGNKMWELRIRSAAEIASLRALIENHNDGCRETCSNKWTRKLRACDAFKAQGRNCPDCPMEDLIELPAAIQSGYTLGKCEPSEFTNCVF